MAYNGGATAATVDTIQREEQWSPAGIGLLGAMDKLGMTIAAAFWGYMLQRCDAKTLLCTGLLTNAGSTMAFGTLRNPVAMTVAKLLIGFTESLQWVWAPLWIGQWAPPALLPIWMNLSGGGVASGIGNGLGTIIAGFTTAQGYSYELAFQIEASVLFALLVALLGTSAQRLIIHSPLVSRSKMRVNHLAHESLEEPLVDTQPREAAQLQVMSQLRKLWGNPLFCRCALAYASANFVNSALQFLWVRIFMELWHLNKDYSVGSFLMISAFAGALGILAASCQRVEHDYLGKVSTLRFVHRAFSGAVLGALVVGAGILPQLHPAPRPDLQLKSLLLTWLGLGMVFVGVTAVPGLLQIMCIESVEEPELRSFATGLAQGANNFLGFAMGPLIPQLVMDILQIHLGWGLQKALALALFTALLGTCMGAVSTTLAVAAIGRCSECDFETDCAISTISHVSSAETESFSSQTVDRSVL